jgi:hypothetical protein
MQRKTLLIICVLTFIGIAPGASSGMADDKDRRENVTVSFGAWQTDPPLDRFPNNSPADRNEHQHIPNEVKINAGGAVNFIISGLHQPIVYDDATKPGDIDVNDTTITTGPVPSPAVVLINDDTDRLYRGLYPSLFPRDRVEVVHFSKPGTYLVICGVRGHFVNDGMFGFVKVKKDKD